MLILRIYVCWGSSFSVVQGGRKEITLKVTFNHLLIAKGVREEIKNNYRILQKSFPLQPHKVDPSEYEINKGILQVSQKITFFRFLRKLKRT